MRAACQDGTKPNRWDKLNLSEEMPKTWRKPWAKLSNQAKLNPCAEEKNL